MLEKSISTPVELATAALTDSVRNGTFLQDYGDQFDSTDEAYEMTAWMDAWLTEHHPEIMNDSNDDGRVDELLNRAWDAYIASR